MATMFGSDTESATKLLMPIRPYTMATATQCAALNFADAPGCGWVSAVTLAANGNIRTSAEAMSATATGL
jgi:hypothetical protein